jgi:hypothetical protein
MVHVCLASLSMRVNCQLFAFLTADCPFPFGQQFSLCDEMWRLAEAARYSAGSIFARCAARLQNDPTIPAIVFLSAKVLRDISAELIPIPDIIEPISATVPALLRAPDGFYLPMAGLELLKTLFAQSDALVLPEAFLRAFTIGI